MFQPIVTILVQNGLLEWITLILPLFYVEFEWFKLQSTKILNYTIMIETLLL